MDDAGEPKQQEKRKTRPVTRDYLFRAAVHYIERYASSVENLRRVLQRKVARRARERGETAGDFEPLIDETLARLLELKLLDDAKFAEARVVSLRRRGTSRRQLAARLAQKGLDRETAERALAADETSEASAAAAYARRRRLGPYRLRERIGRRDRDLAAMARAGFSYGEAARVIDGEAEDASSQAPVDSR